MFAFAASGMLALYLRATSNTALVLPHKTDEPILKLGHFNLSAANDVEPTLAKMLEINADVLSVQEISPEWARPLLDTLKQHYPHKCLLLSTDLYSFGLFSKYPIMRCDTVFCGQAPNLVIRLRSNSERRDILLVSSYIEPPLFEMARIQQKKHLDSLGQYVARMRLPTIAFGNYNLNNNSNEIQILRNIAHLNDSRRGFRPLRDDGHISLLEVPLDHIFYTNHLQCVGFQSISDGISNRIGIVGSYQFTKDSIKTR
jgi:endonuclease/exonuclease/phosphatase (EEP) superfamily protein YafD